MALGLGWALARQLSAVNPSVSVLASLVPAAALFGLGLGCLLQPRRSVSALFPVGLASALVVLLGGRGLSAPEGLVAAGTLLESQGGGPLHPALSGPLGALVVFAGLAPAFVAVGQALARAMEPHPRLRAWGWAVAGALLGGVLFALTGPIGLPPWAWIAGLSVPSALALASSRWIRIAILVAGLAFLLLGRPSPPGRWSPYSLVQHLSTPAGGVVFVDSAFHDLAADLPTRDYAPDGASTASVRRWWSPYRLFRQTHHHGPESVLVLGAGVGNEVAAALAEGVSRVVAVERDRVVLDLGREIHPSAPYADPRVEAVVDDPRHFLRSSRETFDLVIVPRLVSREPPREPFPRPPHRYTREALEEARERLGEGGLLVAHAAVSGDDLRARLEGTFRSAFGEEARVVGRGDEVGLEATLVASSATGPGAPPPGARARGGHPASDDWPWLHPERPGLAPPHLRILGAAAVLVLFVLLLLLRGGGVSGLHLDYLLLGTGFALLVSAAWGRLSLAFGRTWSVDAAVLSSGLVIVLLANVPVLRGRSPSPALVWAVLLAAVGVSGLVPVASLLSAGGAALATLAGTAVLGAALAFSIRFGDEPVAGPPLGALFVGGMAGVVLETVSLATGLRALWPLVLALFALAGLATRLAGRPRV